MKKVILIGAGIMSATLGMLLKQLDPQLEIDIFERLDQAATESSDAWNNAGTGHAAFCELNYTPERSDGSVDISKAIKISESFEISRQFWAFLVQQGILSDAHSFISRIPHMSFVWGQQDIAFLRKRFIALQEHVLFKGMQYSEAADQIKDWVPLIMEGRDEIQPVAATRMELGTDVNFGVLTRSIFAYLQRQPHVRLYFNYEVRNLSKQSDQPWRVDVRERISGETQGFNADFVFIGAGGGSLPLLLKSGIPEAQGYGGFPVSGQWLVCHDPTVIERHHAKVYGRAAVGAPPMSVPHLDTRIIDGKRALFFGPYAGFSTKFLKQGSILDLPLSVRINNVIPMLAAGMDNIPLTKYLIEQIVQSPEERLNTLSDFYPRVDERDWKLAVAGQRVQVIKRDNEHGGILEFGTEIVSANDGSIAALLGASPGASTAVSIMLSLLQSCFPEELHSDAWQAALRAMIPSYGQSLDSNPQRAEHIRASTSEILGLEA